MRAARGATTTVTLLLSICLVVTSAAVGDNRREVSAAETGLPIRGLFSPVFAGDIDKMVRFIRDDLPREGVNALILEFAGYSYQFESHPKLAGPGALQHEDVKRLATACRQARIQLIPLLNCFGHQSWKDDRFRLLEVYPQFDAAPNQPTDYTRSWNPLHPKLHPIIFDLIDELIEATEAEAFHVGLDEVFMMPGKGTPYYEGQSRAEMFALQVNTLREHLAEQDVTMWMWGDRLIPADRFGLDKWEADANTGELATHPAIDKIDPEGIVICDWHYRSAPMTANYFADHGFEVVVAPWRTPYTALKQLRLAEQAKPDNRRRIRGAVQTHWGHFERFIDAYHGRTEEAESFEAAYSLEVLAKRWRGQSDATDPSLPNDRITVSLLLDAEQKDAQVVGSPESVEGVKGRALAFDGEDDGLWAKVPEGMRMEQFTAAFWVNVPNEPTLRRHFFEVTGSRGGIVGEIDWAGRPCVGLVGQLPGRHAHYLPKAVKGADLRSRGWTHLAFVFSSTRGRQQIYIDGQRVGGTKWFGWGDLQTLSVGYGKQKGKPIRATIDEFKLFSRPLDVDEIKTLADR
jgi:hypothetical protein